MIKSGLKLKSLKILLLVLFKTLQTRIPLTAAKGQGYQLQFMETYTDTEDKEVKSKTLNLLTRVEIEKACDSDAQALIPAIEST